jgi:hypothetical protein
VQRVIEGFCLPPDDRNDQFTGLQEYNATNAAPILPMGGGQFTLFQPYSLLEALYESPFFWMVADDTYAKRAFANRGKFTEDVAYARLQHVFGPHAYQNVHIERRKGEESGEIDVLVLFGDRAIVLQAKSKRLTLEARKGNDLQIKGDFKKAIQDSYDQAFVCAKALVEGGHTFKTADGQEIALAMPLKQIFPICIVSDHYPALAFQTRQFLKYESTETISPPLVFDVFTLDTITEMLETPLHLFSYLDLRRRYGKKTLAMHELTLLSTHLKYNLWVGQDVDLVSLSDDIGVHLDVAMIVRREGVPGARSPDGILTRLIGTHVGRILSEIEARPDPHTIDLGLQLLALSEGSADIINAAIERISEEAAQDGANHDFTASFGPRSSGLTIHCSYRPAATAAKALAVHCNLRKYAVKASHWFGLAIDPGTAALRFGVKLEGDWQYDPQMEDAVKKMPEGIRPDKMKNALKARHKLGRNDPCPCGSGRKYKKCCLRR